MKQSIMFGAGLLLAGLAFGAQAQTGSGSKTLDGVRSRGQLVCGVTTGVPGFSLPDSKGVWQGIDADGCRAMAAATLGDAGKVKYVPLSTTNRFTALQSGEIDILLRETTWTLERESSLGLEFAGVNYYDGTGFLVKKAMNVTSAKQLDGATVCVQPGTTTELAIADYFRRSNMKFTPVEIQDLQQIQQAFLSGRCDAYSTDSSALAGFRFQQGAEANEFVLLPELISKEPLGPVVRKGDDKWFDIARWVLFAQIGAEEEGVTQANLEQMMTSTNPDVRRLLGVEGDVGKSMGIDNKWAYNVIKAVGNFGEMWDRDVTPMGVPRGVNNLWTKGGLMYSPPMH